MNQSNGMYLPIAVYVALTFGLHCEFKQKNKKIQL
jgi:hypothetical protein